MFYLNLDMYSKQCTEAPGLLSRIKVTTYLEDYIARGIDTMVMKTRQFRFFLFKDNIIVILYISYTLNCV